MASLSFPASYESVAVLDKCQFFRVVTGKFSKGINRSYYGICIFMPAMDVNGLDKICAIGWLIIERL